MLLPCLRAKKEGGCVLPLSVLWLPMPVGEIAAMVVLIGPMRISIVIAEYDLSVDPCYRSRY
ncbi:hypothetical protein D3C76_1593500 [compost metagenome]